MTSEATRLVIFLAVAAVGFSSGRGAQVPRVRSSTGSAVAASMSPASSTAMLFGAYQRWK